MTETILIAFSKHEFKEFIKGTINEALSEQSILPSNNSKSQEYLTIDEAAKFLKIPKASLYQLTSKREIPFVKRSKRVFFKVSDLVAWQEEGRKKTRSEIERELGRGSRKR